MDHAHGGREHRLWCSGAAGASATATVATDLTPKPQNRETEARSKRPGWHQHIEARLVAGESAYGGESLERPPLELLNLAGWAWAAAEKIARFSS